ncbi:MAG: hypothetical protein JWQ98_611 [Chlorobi bacterium]|nr:hypothetical protein [Chlorobiota bacterium]
MINPEPGHDGADAPKVLVCGGNRGRWHWKDRAHEEPITNGIEAWVFALRGEYLQGIELRAEDLDRYDLIVLNLNFGYLPHYRRVLGAAPSRRARLVGLYEGDLAELHDGWKEWRDVADRCDLIIAINGHGVSALEALTKTPVSFIGIPYPVDGTRAFSVPVAGRSREIFLCAPLLRRPLDYIAAETLGLPMYAFEKTFSRRLPELLEHRSFDKRRYVNRAERRYDNPALSILPNTHLKGFFDRAARSILWMNLDTRYTWGRYVLDAAALAMPIITTRETWHGIALFPDLLVDSPYDIAGARRLAARLLEDDAFYRDVTERASAGLDWYRPEATVKRLREVLLERGIAIG